MNKLPKTYQAGPDATRIQAALTRAGRDRLGIGKDRGGLSADEMGLSPADVRRAGLGRLAFRGAAVVLSAAAIGAGGIETFNYVSDKQQAVEHITDAQDNALAQNIQANERNNQPIEMPNVPPAETPGPTP